MLKHSIPALIVGGLLIGSTATQASLYWDIDTFSYAGGYVSVGDPLEDTFNISENRVGGNYVGTDDGGNETVTSVLFEFTLLDDKDGSDATQSESWQIDLSGAGVASGSSTGWFGVLYFGFGNANVRADIEADGEVAYEISAISGDFRVLSAAITVCTETSNRINRVPDGGVTLALLGAGLLSLGALRRRL